VEDKTMIVMAESNMARVHNMVVNLTTNSMVSNSNNKPLPLVLLMPLPLPILMPHTEDIKTTLPSGMLQLLMVQSRQDKTALVVQVNHELDQVIDHLSGNLVDFAW
jgi:hypothetical protein